MAYVQRGPLVSDLEYGLTDGVVRKNAPSRGGQVETTTVNARKFLDYRHYGSLGLSDEAAVELLDRKPLY